MASDLWGPLAPPRWMSNYEQSLLNKQEGRAAAASFNEAWNAAYGRKQSGQIEAQRSEQQDRRLSERERLIGEREKERDARIAQRQKEDDARKEAAEIAKEKRKIDQQEAERKRIQGESDLNQSIRNWHSAERVQQHFHDAMSDFVKTLSEKQPQASTYGTPGGPDNSVAPWLNAPLKRITKPAPSDSLFDSEQGLNWGGTSYSDPIQGSISGTPIDWTQQTGDFSGNITGESGPLDPTYEDYQRAKADHPALWLDPVTAPTMQKMDQSWNEMEKIRMTAEKNKDAHQAFQNKQELDQMAADVGKQGALRYGQRESAYQKATSDIQNQIDGLPNGGRMPQDSYLTKVLGYPPLTSAAEIILNKDLEDRNQLRIDGANKDAIDQAKIEAFRKDHPEAVEEMDFDAKKGVALKIRPPKTTERAHDEKPIVQDIGGGVRLAYFPGSKTLHVIKGEKIGDEIDSKELLRIAKELPDGENKDLIYQYLGGKSKEQINKKGVKYEPPPKTPGGFKALIDRIFGSSEPSPAPTPPPPGQPQPGGAVTNDFWGTPAPKTATQAAPEPTDTEPEPEPASNTPAPTQNTATNTPAKPKKDLSEADKEKAIRLANEAIRRDPSKRAFIQKRLEDLGIKIKK